MLSYPEAKKFYDAFGKKQDKQFYEKIAIRDLLEHGDFTSANSIFEFGCGTGKVAQLLLSDYSKPETHYVGVDISDTMVKLSADKLTEFHDRVRIYSTDGAPELPEKSNCYDRVICTYVLDLLAEQDIKRVLSEAQRILVTGGYICLISLSHGVSVVSRMVEHTWSFLYRLKPTLVGGCRPISVLKYLPEPEWEILHHNVIVSYGIPSEVLVAKKL